MIDKPHQYLRVFGLAIFLLVPSLDTAGKYFGVPGLALYFAGGLIAIFAGYFLLLPPFLKHVSERTARILAVITFAGLIAIVFVGYPMANSGTLGSGSDVDDAMIVAVTEIVNGNFPYYQKTYLGLPISPLPGAIFLATPWVVARALPYQNIFWLAVLFLVLRNLLNSSALVLALFWAILLSSPTVLQSLVSGSDYISNSIYILVAIWLTLKYAADPESPLWKKLLSAAFLGICLSSRSNFFVVLPLYFGALVHTAGWREAFRLSAVSVAVLAAVTLPFWAYDPAGFSPFAAQAYKMRVLESVLPYAGLLIPGSAMLIAAWFAVRKSTSCLPEFLQANGIVQLYVLLFSSAIFAIQAGKLNLYMANSGYGIFALFFGAIGFWMSLNRDDHAPAA